jgi:hypothetical protein
LIGAKVDACHLPETALRTTVTLFWIVIAGSLVGCAPIVSGVQIVKANIALSAAETAGAKKTAVYEYTAASEYLKKAREENAYADFAASETFADKALDFALRARKKAEAMAGTEQPAALPPR